MALEHRAHLLALPVLLTLVALTACGGGGSGSWLNHVKAIEVTPANPTLAQGLTQAFTATATWEDGSTLDMSTQVTWKSSNISAASVSATGVATASGAGARQPPRSMRALGSTLKSARRRFDSAPGHQLMSLLIRAHF